jgi:hypothetical protein
MPTETTASGTVVMTGAAIQGYRLVVLRSSLKLFGETGIRTHRGFRLRDLLAAASEVTGKRYGASRAGALKASEDLRALMDTAPSLDALGGAPAPTEPPGRAGHCRVPRRAGDDLHRWRAEFSHTNPGLVYRWCAECDEEQGWCDVCGAALDASESEKEAEADEKGAQCVECGGGWNVHSTDYHAPEAGGCDDCAENLQWCGKCGDE